jgi:hypothetical protein
MEEQLASLLYRHLPNMPIVGGSASGHASSQTTHVYVNGAFRTHAAVFTVFLTRLPFRTIKFAHFVPTGQPLVVTHSDPAKRVVYEINGEPAAQVYANLIGVPVAQLDAPTFSMNPLVWEMGGEQYVRSIASANPDQSLTLVLCHRERRGAKHWARRGSGRDGAGRVSTSAGRNWGARAGARMRLPFAPPGI